jgi:hypothetical protein
VCPGSFENQVFIRTATKYFMRRNPGQRVPAISRIKFLSVLPSSIVCAEIPGSVFRQFRESSFVSVPPPSILCAEMPGSVSRSPPLQPVSPATTPPGDVDAGVTSSLSAVPPEASAENGGAVVDDADAASPKSMLNGLELLTEGMIK